MIQKTKSTEILSGGVTSAAHFRLDQKNLAHVFDILRNNLYSDKILAVIREYSTNAYDANVDNGKADEPIVVTLPTAIDPIFKIRDFGKGLSENEIFTIYSSYGESTKRATNDQVGTLGMGSKSAFAYSNSFTITSYNGGTKSIYEAFIDDTNLGMIAKVFSEPSSEPSGIEVSVTVDQKDIRTFIMKAKKFYYGFSPAPVFMNYTGDIIKEWADAYDVIHQNDIYSLILNKQHWNDITIPYGAYAKMGNILYRLPDSFPAKLGLNWLTHQEILCLNVPIGELTFTTSREALEENDSNLAALKVHADKLIKYIQESIAKKIDSLATPWLAYHEFQAMSNVEKRILGNGKNLLYRGKEYDISSLGKYGWMTYVDYRGRWMSNINTYRTPSSTTCFIIPDGGYPQYTMSERRDLARLEAKNKGLEPVYIPLTKSTLNDWLDNPLLDGVPIIRMSKYAVARRAITYKKSKNVLLWNGKTNFPYSTNWDEIDVNKIAKNATYVRIEKYRPINCHTTASKVSNLASVLGVKFSLYGVRGRLTRVSDKWVTLVERETQLVKELAKNKKFPDYVREEMEKSMKKAGSNSYIFVNIRNTKADNILDPDVKNWLKITKNEGASIVANSLSDEEEKARQLMWRVYSDYSYHPIFKIEIIDKIKNEINATVGVNNVSITDLEAKISKKYPLLDRWLGYNGKDGISTTEDYLNAIYLYSQSKSQ